jgi:phospholipid-binding lipoprotein MlaA
MVLPIPFAIRPRGAASAAALALVAGCAAPPPPAAIYDPSEAQNRETHEFNKALDRTLFGPASDGYGGVVPEPVQRGVKNFADNLDLPGDVANNILQLRLVRAAENTVRFVINSTIGLGGVLDPAQAMGVAGKPTDFGETLHVWGVAEGAYNELPVLGPSTDRDTVGRVVDVLMNPVRLAVPDDAKAAVTAAGIAGTLGDRARFGDTIDSILYDSADSYAQARLLYLQNRRFELGQTGGEDDFVDPYAE